MFSVVNFPETDDVEVAPNAWLDENDTKCWWPPFKSWQNIQKAVKLPLPVDMRTWNLYNCRIIKSFATYDLARQKLAQSAVTSNLSSEDEDQPLPKTRGGFLGHKKTLPPPPSPDADSRDDSQERGKLLDSPPPLVTKKGQNKKSGCGVPKRLEFKSPIRAVSVPYVLGLAEGSGCQNEDSPSPDKGDVSISSTEIQLHSTRTDKPGLFQENVIKSLANIHLQLTSQNQTLMKISNILLKQPNQDKLDFHFEFPLSTITQLDKLETSLEDKAQLKSLVVYLSGIGGADYKECIASILRRVITDDLATLLCWEGIRKSNPKRPFKDLKLKNAIFKAVLSTPTGQCSNATEHDMKTKIASWLQHSSDRIKQAKSKKQNVAEGETGEL